MGSAGGTVDSYAVEENAIERLILDALEQWQATGSNSDCPLPELYRHAAPFLTLGLFHDGLRSLHEQHRIYLHPWTGPMCEIPQPECALLVGHEVAYYASLRGDQ
jgi:hypothetical protein